MSDGIVNRFRLPPLVSGYSREYAITRFKLAQTLVNSPGFVADTYINKRLHGAPFCRRPSKEGGYTVFTLFNAMFLRKNAYIGAEGRPVYPTDLLELIAYMNSMMRAYRGGV